METKSEFAWTEIKNKDTVIFLKIIPLPMNTYSSKFPISRGFSETFFLDMQCKDLLGLVFGKR